MTVHRDKSAATAKTTQGEGEASLSERAGDSGTSHGRYQPGRHQSLMRAARAPPGAGLASECLRGVVGGVGCFTWRGDHYACYQVTQTLSGWGHQPIQ